MINLTINEKGRANNIQRAREQNIIIPTIAQMKNPQTIPEKIRDQLRNVGLWEVNPLNLFRITCSGSPGRTSRRNRADSSENRISSSCPRN